MATEIEMMREKSFNGQRLDQLLAAKRLPLLKGVNDRVGLSLFKIEEIEYDRQNVNASFLRLRISNRSCIRRSSKPHFQLALEAICTREDNQF